MIFYGILLWVASVTGIVLFFMGAYPAEGKQVEDHRGLPPEQLPMRNRG